MSLRSTILLLSLFTIHHSLFAGNAGLSSLPDSVPQNYHLRDFRQTAIDYDTLVFDFTRSGPYLPLIWWDTSKTNIDRTGFALPAYVGDLRQTPARLTDYDAITCLGSVLGALSVGIDKSNQHGRDYVSMLSIYYRSANATNLYLNNSKARTGRSFWYELFPSLLFIQIHSHFPDNSEQQKQLIAIANQWLRPLPILTPATPAKSPPDFNHTSFDFETMRPFDNLKWREPDAAAAVAFIHAIAHHNTGNSTYLDAANLSLRYLDQLEKNPLYEILLPYGAYTSARLNAEHSTTHDTAKLLTWTFDGSNKRRWGMINESWNGTPLHGLIGSIHENHEYAFAMNTYATAGIIAPVARYADEYAPAIAKWLLHLAANSRYFYPDAWPATHQSSYAWSSQNDPKFSIAYEGIRKNPLARSRPTQKITLKGTQPKSPSQKVSAKPATQLLSPDSTGNLDYAWLITLPAGTEHTLVIDIDPDLSPKLPVSIEVFISNNTQGPWQKILSAKSGAKPRQWTLLDPALTGPHWIRLTTTSASTTRKTNKSTGTSTSLGSPRPRDANVAQAAKPAPLASQPTDTSTSNRTIKSRVSDVTPTAKSAPPPPRAGEAAPQESYPPLPIKEIYITTRLPKSLSPYPSGDPLYLGWGRTDLGLYGSSLVGLLGALISPTDVEAILAIDTRATDPFAPPGYPTRLYYNPHELPKTITHPTGTSTPQTLYDTLSNQIIATNVTTSAPITLRPNQSLQLVQYPSTATLTRKNTHLYANDLLIDYTPAPEK